MSARFEFMDDDQQHQEEELSASAQGILGCIEVGLAHLTPEQRRLWESDAQSNLLMSEEQNPGSNIGR